MPYSVPKHDQKPTVWYHSGIVRSFNKNTADYLLLDIKYTTDSTSTTNASSHFPPPHRRFFKYMHAYRSLRTDYEYQSALQAAEATRSACSFLVLFFFSFVGYHLTRLTHMILILDFPFHKNSDHPTPSTADPVRSAPSSISSSGYFRQLPATSGTTRWAADGCDSPGVPHHKSRVTSASVGGQRAMFTEQHNDVRRQGGW